MQKIVVIVSILWFKLAEKIAENKPAYKAGYRTIDEIGRERIIRAAKKLRRKIQDLKPI